MYGRARTSPVHRPYKNNKMALIIDETYRVPHNDGAPTSTPIQTFGSKISHSNSS